jgi:hypothetical protein
MTPDTPHVITQEIFNAMTPEGQFAVKLLVAAKKWKIDDGKAVKA